MKNAMHAKHGCHITGRMDQHGNVLNDLSLTLLLTIPIGLMSLLLFSYHFPKSIEPKSIFHLEKTYTNSLKTIGMYSSQSKVCYICEKSLLTFTNFILQKHLIGDKLPK